MFHICHLVWLFMPRNSSKYFRKASSCAFTEKSGNYKKKSSKSEGEKGRIYFLIAEDAQVDIASTSRVSIFCIEGLEISPHCCK